MNYEQLMCVHLVTVVPCFFIGGILLLISKGTPRHKLWGKIYLCLMLFTATVTLFMPAKVGPQFFGHFGYIHLFSFLTLYTGPTAIIAIRKGNLHSHKRKMILLYFGAILIAGGFTFFPGRFLHQVFFGS
jgi:uncharacterized membrane protein